jgi:hypothetical protein
MTEGLIKRLVLKTAIMNPQILLSGNQPPLFAAHITIHHSVQNLLSFCLFGKNLNINTYKAIILPVVLCGCEIWFLTLREERRLRVIENTVLRRIFGPKGEEVVGGWRRMHNEELHNLYASPILG